MKDAFAACANCDATQEAPGGVLPVGWVLVNDMRALCPACKKGVRPADVIRPLRPE